MSFNGLKEIQVSLETDEHFSGFRQSQCLSKPSGQINYGNSPRQQHSVSPDLAHIWYTLIPQVPDVGWIWADTMLPSEV